MLVLDSFGVGPAKYTIAQLLLRGDCSDCVQSWYFEEDGRIELGYLQRACTCVRARARVRVRVRVWLAVWIGLVWFGLVGLDGNPVQ